MLDSNESYDLLDTDEMCFIGGYINMAHISGPNEATIEIFLKTPIPTYNPEKRKGIEEFRYDKFIIKREDGEDYSPIYLLEEIYASHGAIVRLTHSNGVRIPYYYNLFRR